MKMFQRCIVFYDSSMINSIEYNVVSTEDEIEIEFNTGDSYRYTVSNPIHLIKVIATADSPGKIVNELKDHYEGVKVENEMP